MQNIILIEFQNQKSNLNNKMKTNYAVKLFVSLIIISTITILPIYVKAQNNPEKKKIVCFKITPPFIIKEDGKYSGVSIYLWENIAKKLNIDFTYKEYQQLEMSEMLNDIEKGNVDLCISPLTVTGKRLEHFNFTYPFYSSDLVIVTARQQKSKYLKYILNIFSTDFFSAVFYLLSLLFIFGTILWIVEKNKNPQEFQKGIKGIGDGIWWAAVTMTTVGFGDKSPKTFAGRLIATIWMFWAIIIISSLTGSIAASLTMDKINSEIKSVENLKTKKVGTFEGTSCYAFLERKGVTVTDSKCKTIEQCLDEIVKNKIDAFVYDEPVLKYIIMKTEYLNEKVQILPLKLNTDYYSFAIPDDFAMRDTLNELLVKELESAEWQEILTKYNLK